jgi:hypothetical protein
VAAQPPLQIEIDLVDDVELPDEHDHQGLATGNRPETRLSLAHVINGMGMSVRLGVAESMIRSHARSEICRR